ncbi:hypothetical protein [Corynebacterium mayonis]|uniref:hypothetical protein n=1 Tax=Corynebacterium mayonis TaxID=3062461 RepID=UPI00314051B4
MKSIAHTVVRTASAVAVAGGLTFAGAGLANAEDEPTNAELREQYSDVLYQYYGV